MIMKLNATQLFSLIFLFEMGSAMVIPLGMGAEKDAWIAILMGLCIGIAFYWVHMALFRQYPEIPFTAYTRIILGKYIGWIIGMLYTLYFIYIAARVLRDFGDLLVTTQYDQTPVFIVNGMFMLVLIYVIYQGIEVLARLGEIFVLFLIMTLIFGNIFILLSGIVEIKSLLPILDKGWEPVLKELPLTSTVPFGEIVVFTMLFPYFNQPEVARKIGTYTMVLSGLVLSYIISINIAVLGESIAKQSHFPLLKTVSKINVADVIQNVDVIALLTLIIGGFFKIAIFFYAGVVGVADLFQVKKEKTLVFAIGFTILFSSIVIANNFIVHIEEGLKVVPVFLHIPIQFAIPLLLFIIDVLRRKARGLSS